MRRRLTAAVVLTLALSTSACGDGDDRTLPPAWEEFKLLPVPERIGDLRFQRESGVEGKLASAGDRSMLEGVQVFTARNGNNLVGYLEIGEFKEEYPATRSEVRQGVLDNLGGGKPQPTRIGEEVVFVKQGLEQRFIIWFAPSGRYFHVLVAGRKLNDPERLFGELLAAQAGRPEVVGPRGDRFDPRRGGSQ